MIRISYKSLYTDVQPFRQILYTELRISIVLFQNIHNFVHELLVGLSHFQQDRIQVLFYEFLLTQIPVLQDGVYVG